MRVEVLDALAAGDGLLRHSGALHALGHSPGERHDVRLIPNKFGVCRLVVDQVLGLGLLGPAILFGVAVGC